jgi:hypothetical protein
MKQWRNSTPSHGGSGMGTHLFDWITNLLVEYYFNEDYFSNLCY